jgi:hypothetical protein
VHGSASTEGPQLGLLGSITVADAIEQAAKGPSRRTVIDPLVALEETALLQSQPRDGKSWFMLAGGLAVASGTTFAGRFATTQTNVLYTTNEDGERAIVNRLEMLMKGMEIKRPPEGFRLFVGKGLWLDDPDWQRKLIAEVKTYRIGLLQFDPLRSLTACVDKGPSDLQPFARFLRRLISETGCGEWCSHHEIKQSPNFPDERRAAQRSSGGGLFSAMDAPISIERIDDTQSRFVPDGFKHCDTPAPFILDRLIHEGAAYISVRDAPEHQSGADLALLDEVRAFLRTHPNSSGRQVERGVRKQADKVRDALGRLADNGEARYISKGKAHLWSLK